MRSFEEGMLGIGIDKRCPYQKQSFRSSIPVSFVLATMNKQAAAWAHPRTRYAQGKDQWCQRFQNASCFGGHICDAYFSTYSKQLFRVSVCSCPVHVQHAEMHKSQVQRFGKEVEQHEDDWDDTHTTWKGPIPRFTKMRYTKIPKCVCSFESNIGNRGHTVPAFLLPAAK